MHFGFRDREVVEEEFGRRPRDHAQIRQVGRRIANEKVVDIVLAGVHTRRERRPRGRRFRRMRRLERIETTLLRKLRDIWQLALGYPLVEQMWVHAVEAEDDELLLE